MNSPYAVPKMNKGQKGLLSHKHELMRTDISNNKKKSPATRGHNKPAYSFCPCLVKGQTPQSIWQMCPNLTLGSRWWTEVKEYWLYSFPSSLVALFIHTLQWNKQCFPSYRITQHNCYSSWYDALWLFPWSPENQHLVGRMHIGSIW